MELELKSKLMKYKKLELKSSWEIVKEDDDYLLAIVLHRGEEESDRLADAIVSLLNGPTDDELKTRGEVEAYCAGLAQAIWLYAWWKDGVQYVGCGIYTMESALKEVEWIKQNRMKALKSLPGENLKAGLIQEFDEWMERFNSFLQDIAPSYRSPLIELLAERGLRIKEIP